MCQPFWQKTKNLENTAVQYRHNQSVYEPVCLLPGNGVVFIRFYCYFEREIDRVEVANKSLDNVNGEGHYHFLILKIGNIIKFKIKVN